MAAACGAPGIAPSHLPCRWISPSLTHTCEAKGWERQSPESDLLEAWGRQRGQRPGWRAQNRPPETLLEQVLPGTPACAQHVSRSKTQPNLKTNTGKQTQEVTPTGQRSPEAPARDAARDLTRHDDTALAGEGSRKGRGVSHFRYNCRRVSKEDGGAPSGRSQLGFFCVFFFVFFKLSFINNI